MNRVSVTIVDFMAFLVPGVTLMFGLVLLPLPDPYLLPLNETLLRRLPILENPWVAGGCWVLAAYVLGFLLRLVSIDLMNFLTAYRWAKMVRYQGEQLAEALEDAINDPKLTNALSAISEQRKDRGVGKTSAYFHFAKRVVRTQPELWVEAERLEAEVRLAAGLFLPFVILAFAGGFRIPIATASGVLLLLIGVLGAGVVVATFPDRRIKEVLYDQLLAIIALKLLAQRPPARRDG